MKFLSTLLILTKAEFEGTTTGATTTEKWIREGTNDQLSELNGVYRTADKYGRRLEIEYLEGSVFQVFRI